MHEGHSAFRPLIRVMYLLAILSLSSGLFQRSESQDISEYEILALGQQLKVIEDKITPIDSELNLLVPEYDRITNEISELKTDLLESKGIFSGITEIFKKRRIGNLSTQAQEMNQKITQLQKKREPLAKEFIIIADRLIDKCGLRIVTLMDSLLKNTTDDNISIRISAIW